MRYLPNGQWTLEPLKKNDENNPSIAKLVGNHSNMHTVEVHPDIDHLYNIKGLIQNSGKPSLPLGEIKRSNIAPHLVNKLPRDARGRVSPEMIDQHIASLPKKKVQILVTPYTMRAQQHRAGPQEYVASVGLPKEERDSWSPEMRQLWEHMRRRQHDLGGHGHQLGWSRIDPHRANPEVNLEDGTYDQSTFEPNPGHWHLDEIQSDFGTPEKVRQALKSYNDPDELRFEINHYPSRYVIAHPQLLEARDRMHDAATRMHRRVGQLLNEHRKLPHDQIAEKIDADELMRQAKQDHTRASDNYHSTVNDIVQQLMKERGHQRIDPKEVFKTLSMNHEDPQHLVHSAVNQLARQNGITSTSMDMPNDQAHQSGLKSQKPTVGDAAADRYYDIIEALDRQPFSEEELNHLHNTYAPQVLDQHNADIHFKNASEKLPPEAMRKWADWAAHDRSSWLTNGATDPMWDETTSPEYWSDTYGKQLDPVVSEKMRSALANMSPEERNALSRFAQNYQDHALDYGAETRNIPSINNYQGSGEEPEYDLPVHYMNTYDKRPRKLGMVPTDKQKVLGEDPYDDQARVQYGKLYKKLHLIREFLEKIENG